LQILIEHLANIFFERPRVTNDYDSPLRHHRRRGKEHSQCLGIEVCGPSDIEVEVSGARFQGSLDQLLYSVILLVVVVPRDVIRAVERAALDGIT
jgi:hypothetical protein